jgi:UDP-N-acetylglucosamine 2-epimerase (non-hydrolysing)
MPEEINRLLTDQLSDLLFTPSEDGNQNLAKEGIAKEKVHLVGNVMIDTLLRMLPAASAAAPSGAGKRYILVTLHRPSNVDDLPWLRSTIEALDQISREAEVIFPIHPRTRQRLVEAGIRNSSNGRVQLRDPAPYLEFLALQMRAALVITDSGGIQEETTYLGIPCLTVRENTERPITVSMGTNQLVGRDIRRIKAAAMEILGKPAKRLPPPPLWDGYAAERIANVIVQHRGARTSTSKSAG